MPHYRQLIYDERLPRKMKKKQLGYRVQKSKLRRMLSETVVGEPIKTMYQCVQFTPHGEFCPSCGSSGYYGTGNMAQYPEHWGKFHCLRCGTVVGYIDNSPFVHALECEDNNYDPQF